MNLNLTTQKIELNLFLRHLRQSVYNPTPRTAWLGKKTQKIDTYGSRRDFSLCQTQLLAFFFHCV